MNFKYDVIVVGAGHAGCEAAAAAANMGSRTLLITMDMNKVAQMSCNPAVGGIAKGQIVREIDALGGYMGIVTDNTAIQFRMLNRSKGPAMWSPRAQSDRAKFIQEWRGILENLPNLYMWQDTVRELIVEDGRVCGVKTYMNVEFRAGAVVLTNGTFLNGLIHIGRTQLGGGRMSEPAAFGLTEQLVSLGMEAGRMKTGTPVRIDGRSVHFEETVEQKGENDFHKFSYLDYKPRKLKQLSCWTLYTNESVHDVLRSGLADSPMYNGQIQSIGPRYCPSIETKIVTFADKTQHQLFLEPEGETTQEYYLNGFSSSLPLDIQLRALREIPAFRDVHIYRPGYAIEYDFFMPTQLHHSLETKLIKNLFFAGQINGTTGYEEAGGQGIIAGINAHIGCHGGDPFILGRDEAYIGVLIDDLVTKGVDEPYRMFTSRAEYRILLRQDDADVRLTQKAAEIGLAKQDRLDLLKDKEALCDMIISFANNYSIKPQYINPGLEALEATPLKQGCKLIDLITRPQLNINNLSELVPSFRQVLDKLPESRKEEIIEAAEIRIKYDGYIRREQLIADKINRLEHIKIKGKFVYNDIQSLSTEARQKLTKIDPDTIAQASRIPGISPSDINILLVLLGR
ncbi:MAG: tRNA uridine-5-carboxymethylaminomethyl(34) synthesis enzyme MnmG [Parabacteroides sp.]|jgi:tRNA uridine 5-carboxymethylaminomethyl modification enzyme|uniref:tRNA uridine 5-carboxymethylaminomethyl modification enzyme MnmG n=3 Tax=Bacteroidales TaxID=171549 RepID=A0A1T5ABK4_9BACT|nr:MULTISPECIES: tRNA uridine-5-carboxymethylaminomethyl(34) synthesis enzyme MnmG [Bacteroidales]MBP7871496.1 tRNA uridine-5-carboxymethylaminomethyl(34) synthesis enzyme MnmG [Parabacteroides sp.]MDT3367345.1 tRNA uridine-5-carboxymethylaminomethyl(34) synthesis enzyme MnmG [Bacteroidota bacterium]MBP8012092.1 tRNA uridine-5-carboxymethylaminomethyl(34) synthesis enzyme MnmG [Parabacteroides sp.]MDD3508741.1 tRNA uridine-5-carboxymethylaminomethyl(34) synthesis enzyme MnmG [Parabacteroides sp